MQIELSDKQIQAIIAILDNSNFKGVDVEFVSELKKSLKEAK